MARAKGITKLHLQSSPDAKAEVVVHEKPQDVSQDLMQFTAHFAALKVDDSAPASPVTKSQKKDGQRQRVNRSNSTPEFANVFLDPEDSVLQHQSYLIEQSVFNKLLQIMPSMIEEYYRENITLESPDLPIETQKIQCDIEIIKNKQADLQNKLEGYKSQIQTWTNRIKATESSVEILEGKFEQESSEDEPGIGKLFPSPKIKLQNELELEELQKLKTNLRKLFEKCNEDQVTLQEVNASQNFVSDRYDVFLREQTAMKNEVKEIKQKLAKQENKTEHMNNYFRWDHVVFGGVPPCLAPDGSENCKLMVVNICKELHYNIPINEISTAHRLKQHPDKSGPPNIIVRFKDRDIRNDVLKLRSQLKEKYHWRNYGIQRLFINEQLTPEKNKLMYLTKIFSREMFRIHGKIFVWSFKGDIYIRKAVEGAPKIKINCEKDLNDIRGGIVSLDANTRYNMRTAYTSASRANADVIEQSVPPVFSLQNYPLPSRY